MFHMSLVLADFLPSPHLRHPQLFSKHTTTNILHFYIICFVFPLNIIPLGRTIYFLVSHFIHECFRQLSLHFIFINHHSVTGQLLSLLLQLAIVTFEEVHLFFVGW